MTATYDFTGDSAIQQGVTFDKRIEWRNANNSPVNLTGFTAKMQVRRRASSETYIVELSTENGRISIGEGDGSIHLFLSALETNLLPNNPGVYDLILTSPGNYVYRFMTGLIEISAKITR